MTETPPDTAIAYDQRLARWTAARLAPAPVSPNMVTATSLGVGLSAAWLFAAGGGAVHWAAGLFVVAVWLDHLDGELARATGRTSRFGHYFDHVAASTNVVAMFVCAGVGLRGGVLGGWAVPLGVAAGLAVAAIFLVRIGVELRDGGAAVRQTVRGGFEIEDTLYLVGPVTWVGALAPFVAAAGVGAPLFLVWVIRGALGRPGRSGGRS